MSTVSNPKPETKMLSMIQDSDRAFSENVLATAQLFEASRRNCKPNKPLNPKRLDRLLCCGCRCMGVPVEVALVLRRGIKPNSHLARVISKVLSGFVKVSSSTECSLLRLMISESGFREFWGLGCHAVSAGVYGSDFLSLIFAPSKCSMASIVKFVLKAQYTLLGCCHQMKLNFANYRYGVSRRQPSGIFGTIRP